MISSLARSFYPRLSGPQKFAGLNFHAKHSNFFGVHSRRFIHEERLRQRLIHEISKNPNILSTGGASITSRKPSWTRRLAIFASSCCVFMGIYFGNQVYQVYVSKEEDSEPRNVFFPLWFGLNWPKKRHFQFPAYLHYMDPAHPALADINSSDYIEALRRDHVEHQVLDCLFRSPIVREIFKLPISVRATQADRFDVWIEPKYPTFHGPLFSICKNNGNISITSSWQIKSVKWSTDINDIVTGMTSELESLAATEAQHNVHDKSSGRVHQANLEEDKKNQPLECSSAGEKTYDIAFRGTLEVTDISKQHTGSVAYTGIIDSTHMGLSGGVRILSLTLDVSEYGKSSVLYKLK
ncbi:hypothetical protein OXX80_007193 [Metschnikowia pulcherrima]